MPLYACKCFIYALLCSPSEAHRVEVTKGLVIFNKSLCSAYWLCMSFVSYHNLLMREWFVTHLIYCSDPAKPLVQQWYIMVQFNIILHTKAIVNYLTISHGHSVYASYTITRSGDLIFRTAVVTKVFGWTEQCGLRFHVATAHLNFSIVPWKLLHLGLFEQIMEVAKACSLPIENIQVCSWLTFSQNITYPCCST